MLDEGTATRSALQISDELQRLGAQLGTGSDLDTTSVTLSALKANLDPSLALFADVVLNPSFPAAELERLQTAAARRDRAGGRRSRSAMALRVLPRCIYGAGHAYAMPLTGSGTEAVGRRSSPATSVARLARHLVQARQRHADRGRRHHARPRSARSSRSSSPAGRAASVPKKNVAAVEAKAPERRLRHATGRAPCSPRSSRGHVAPPRANPQEIAQQVMNNVLGGQFISRVNMNLREDKHWSYGAGTRLLRRARPAAVHRLRPGADRQDEGVGGRAAEGDEGHPRREAGHRRRAAGRAERPRR